VGEARDGEGGFLYLTFKAAVPMRVTPVFLTSLRSVLKTGMTATGLYPQ
jgi:hypothetical protein